MIFQSGALAPLTDDLHISPGDSASPSSANGFHSSLFGGEARSQTLGGVRLPGAISDLFRGENSPEKTFSMALQRLPDSRHFSDVNSSSNDHTQGTGYRLQGTVNKADVGWPLVNESKSFEPQMNTNKTRIKRNREDR